MTQSTPSAVPLLDRPAVDFPTGLALLWPGKQCQPMWPRVLSPTEAVARRSRRRILLIFGVLGWILSGSAANAESPQFTTGQLEFFETKVRPLLVQRCHKCHGESKQQGHLRLDSRESILQGGDSGPAIVAGKPEESELVGAIRYDPDGYQMPPTGKLPEEDIETLVRWVEMGAPWPEEAAIVDEVGTEFNLAERARRWSFQPLKRPRIPSVAQLVIPAQAGIQKKQSIESIEADIADQSSLNSRLRGNDRELASPLPTTDSWCRNPIDRFLLAKLAKNGLSPAAEADRSTLLRRASFDVLGLPPAPEQVETFVSDESPDAYEQWIDDLLASPHFGERWGRHWLDLVRYAEGRGHEFDYDVANPWHYRDYVIRALNDDVPYDQFVVEHVAGDLLTTDTDHSLRLHPLTGANESILATGFWFFGEWIHSPVDIRQDEADRFANMLDVYSKTFLGLTVACARCHDHKFDPITTKDFYALQGYLQSSCYRQVRFETMEHNRQIARALDDVELRATPLLATEFSQIAKEALADLDEYLLAAYEVVRDQKNNPAAQPIGVSATKNIARVPEEKTLDAARLNAWVLHLARAAKDPSDLFHFWGGLSSGTFKDVETVEAAIAETYQNRKADCEQEESDGHRSPEFNNWIWLRTARGDGSLYQAPMLDPILTLQKDPFASFSRLHDRDIPRALNPVFGELKLAESVTQEPGSLANWQRANGTLWSDTFEISQDKLYFRIRGGCNTYVAVDSHILIKGPLHGSLLKEHPTPAEGADEWRWVQHDVSGYQGHRAHVEFVVRNDERFAIERMIAKGRPDNRPQYEQSYSLDVIFHPYSPPFPNLEIDLFLEKIEKKPLERTPEWLARFIRDSLLEEVRTFRTWYRREYRHHGRFPNDRVIEWICRHDSLFGLKSNQSQAALLKVAQPFLQERRQLIDRVRNVSATAPAIADLSGEDEYVFIRGNWKKRGETVPRRFLEVFDGEKMRHPDHGSGRLELAEHMVDPTKTPILPRVIVNRIWQHYFGRGIVPTPDDFGYMGQDPSHPELLDWLASELVSHDWSTKHIHRLILTSAAYRMSSDSVVGGPSSVDVRHDKRSLPHVIPARAGIQITQSAQPKDISGHLRDSRLRGNDGLGHSSRQTLPNPADVDPDNRLLHRMNVKRLEGEAIRDAILTLSGRLDERMYGKSVPVHLTPFMEGRGRPEVSGPVDGDGRRSVYIAVRRNFPEPFFQAFDMPTPHTTVGRRNVSNVPAQALAMLNNPLVVEQARRWGEQLVNEYPSADVDTRIRHAYLASISRKPTEAEIAAARDFLMNQPHELGSGRDEARAWGDLCHVLLNAKEFLFVR